ncbi:MAG TPA: hypothetical protein VGP48_06665 [Stellaceae bacterium]|jgi:ElaB/YqjD/DUF883 family membrane-anchored ribosome-binding protein|nr:hypothetical protein [Stellaceae bacterium]
MSNIPNDAKQAVAQAKAAVVTERRHLAARLIAWLRAHPHTMLAITAAVVVLAVTIGVLRG